MKRRVPSSRAKNLEHRLGWLVPITSMVRSIIFERLLQSLLECHLGLPTECFVDLAKVAVIVANIDGLPIVRKRNEFVVATAVEFCQQCSQFFQADALAVAQVEHLTICSIARSRAKQRIDYVGHEIEIASLLSVAKNLNWLLFDQTADPNAKKCLPCIFDPHPWSVGVGQS